VAGIPLRGEEGRYLETGVHGGRKFFQAGRDFSGARGSGGERQKRLPSSRWHAFPGLPLPTPGFLRPPASRGGLRKPGSVLLSEKDFLPIGGWAAKYCGDVEG
jgi:hypothetical protein